MLLHRLRLLTNIGKLGKIKKSSIGKLGKMKEEKMNNEEILRAAQEQGEANDEFERNVIRKGMIYSLVVTVFICVAMCIAEMLIFKKIDFGKPALILFASAFSDLYESSKIKSKKKTVLGIIECVLALGLVILYIGALI